MKLVAVMLLFVSAPGLLLPTGFAICICDRDFCRCVPEQTTASCCEARPEGDVDVDDTTARRDDDSPCRRLTLAALDDSIPASPRAATADFVIDVAEPATTRSSALREPLPACVVGSSHCRVGLPPVFAAPLRI